MPKLFINACVRGDSRTLVLCEEYLRRRWAAGDADLQRLDLQSLELRPFDGAMLAQRQADLDAGALSSPRYDLARDFAAADELLIGAPYWDMSFPALLKVYLEHVCVTGLTFGYTPSGLPQGLCRARRLTYITTVGGYLPEPCSLALYLGELCGLFGIPELRFHAAQGLDVWGSDAQAILAGVMDAL